jgi:hypothetical protein
MCGKAKEGEAVVVVKVVVVWRGGERKAWQAVD